MKEMIDFFHYDLETVITYKDLLNVLKVFSFIKKSIDAATDRFLIGDYFYFDPHVSDNLCQIRAYKLSLYVKNKQVNSKLIRKFSEKLDLFWKNIYDFEFYIKSNHNSQNLKIKFRNKSHGYGVKLIDLLRNHEICLNLKVPDIVFFISSSYILSKYKKVNAHGLCFGIDYSKILIDIDLQSKTLANRIIHKLQRNLSLDSCQFIFKLMSSLNCNRNMFDIMRLLYRRDDIGRHLLPAYEVMKVILDKISISNDIIAFKVFQISKEKTKELKFVTRPSVTKVGGEISLNINNIAFENVFTITGISNYIDSDIESEEVYIKKFIAAGCKKIILLNMAQHHQFTGSKTHKEKENPYSIYSNNKINCVFSNHVKRLEEEFIEHKNASNELGCSYENSSLFLITHINYEQLNGGFYMVENSNEVNESKNHANLTE